MMKRRVILSAWILLGLVSCTWGAEPAVLESARRIPLAYDVDVLVVGGGTGAVSAAVTAAEQGASVFLAAPYPYLGDDMTATLRLWLEEGEQPESPLAKALFDDPVAIHAGPHPDRLPFSYSAGIASAAPHRDTDPPGRLNDALWGNPASQSVQFDGSVSITADLGEPRAMCEARVYVYHRASGDPEKDFKVQRVTFATSNDGKQWTEAAAVEVEKNTGDLILLAAPLKANARFVRFDIAKAEDASRVLIGEIEILRPAAQRVAKAEHPRPPRPLHIKQTLEKALIDAGVPFLFGCYATDLLTDDHGAPAGIVMANRAGRQAVLARTIIDATERGTVTRMAGAKFRPYPAGPQTFRRTVIGGEPVDVKDGSARVVDAGLAGYCSCGFPGRCPTCLGQQRATAPAGPFKMIEYTLKLPMPDAGYRSFAAADQLARTLTYHEDQQITADRLFQVPPDAMHGRQSIGGDSLAVGDLPLDAFRPAGVDRLYLLGGAADVSRARAERLVRPRELIDLGMRIGAAAAAEAAKVAKPSGVRLAGKVPNDTQPGDVYELLTGVRPVQQLPTIEQETRGLPVLGRYDVLVIGGGTGGAPAGIAAGREGAKVLVVEALHMLGGVGTAGYISRYYWGNRVGFTSTVPGGAAWRPEQRAEWWRKTLLDEGAEIWFGTTGCGSVAEQGRVVGAVVATPFGRGAVLADVVIDATGNADVAAAAGAEIDYTGAGEFGMQGTGLPPRRLGADYTNTDFTLVDETDMLDMWHVFVYSKQKYPEAFDQGQLIDTRERRRIVGDFYMTVLDQMLDRTYPDTICQAHSDFDSHGFTIDPYLFLETPPNRAGFTVNIPYRCLLPKDLEGILVTGLAVSVHRDAVPLTRMQPDIQNQGYAAGLAAAMASRRQIPLRSVDIRALQQKLVEVGNLSPDVLEQTDFLPLSEGEVAVAVNQAPNDFRAAAVVFAHPKQALPLMRDAFEASEGDTRYAYARQLAMLGDPTGVGVILQRLAAATEWDEGWNYRGMGQFGAALSPIDVDLIALGFAGDRRALPAILDKVAKLDADADFSHHRAVAIALERLGDPSAAPALAALLAKPGMTGHVHDSVLKARTHDAIEARNTNAVHTRRESLRELFLARALYRLGDHQEIGRKILQNYTKDLRGHLARHAKAVLEP